MRCDMSRSLEDKIKSLPKERQQKIQQRTNELIAEEMSLRDIRKALKQTQEDLGNKLHIGQDGISRLEKRSDMLLSTLNKYIEAMGGSVKVIAEFPDRGSVQIKSFNDLQS